MKEREEKKADLEREEKKRDYKARKMHYLLSTKQVGLPVPDSSCAAGAPADRDKLAAWMGHDWVKDITKTRLRVQFRAAGKAHAGPLLACDSGFLAAAAGVQAGRHG